MSVRRLNRRSPSMLAHTSAAGMVRSAASTTDMDEPESLVSPIESRMSHLAGISNDLDKAIQQTKEKFSSVLNAEQTSGMQAGNGNLAPTPNLSSLAVALEKLVVSFRNSLDELNEINHRCSL